MSTKSERLNARIKGIWKCFFFITIFLAIILVVVFYAMDLKEKKYMEEYESTTWRETEAVLNRNYHHREIEEHEDEDTYVDYYDWYFTYQGLDGNSHTYLEKDHLHEAPENYATTIYVDENDDSHALKIEDFSDKWETRWMVILLLVILDVGCFGSILAVLYIGKYISSNL